MKQKLPLIAAAASLLALTTAEAIAEEPGNWKKGRLYYRAVCTACHVDEAGGSIAPAEYKIQEWKDYLEAERGVEHVGQYIAQSHREAAAPENKVAAAFAKLTDEELLADVRAFVVYGAKDSATPATCN